MTIVVERSVVPLRGVEPGSPVALEEGASIRELLRRFGNAAEDDASLLPVVNGESKRLDAILRDGDRVSVYRLSAGG